MVRDKTPLAVAFDVLLNVFMGLVIVVTLYPTLNILASSLSSADAVEKNLVSFFPREFTLRAYTMIFENSIIPRSYVNSIFYTLVGTAISMVLTVAYAYPLSKKNLPLRKLYTVLIMVTMYFAGGLIPSFLLVRNLGMYNKASAMLLPGAVSAYNVIVMSSFFKSIPAEIEESAVLDGANDFVILFSIVLPLSTASLATVGLFYAVARWNNWFSALLYLKDSAKFPLPLILRELIIENKLAEMMNVGGQAGNLGASYNANYMLDVNSRRVNAETLKYATLFASMLPMAILYPFAQKYFIKGVMLGSLKG